MAMAMGWAAGSLRAGVAEATRARVVTSRISQVLALMNPQVMLTMDIPHLAERLAELVCPVLVFWGANDRMMPENGLLAMAHHCRAMKLILLSECGHWVMVEHEALFNTESLRFLAADGEHTPT